MKIFPAGSLTLAATLLLQLGSFANAMPTFTDTSYLGDLEACKDFRITYPSTTGYSFEDSSRHAVVWEVPEGATQVNLTLIENSTKDIRYVGIYPASQKSSDQIPFLLGSDEGDYHFHAESYGATRCTADSVDFRIEKRAWGSEDSQSDPDNFDVSHANGITDGTDSISEWETEGVSNTQDSSYHIDEELDNAVRAGSLQNVASASAAAAAEEGREAPGSSGSASQNWESSSTAEPVSHASEWSTANASKEPHNDAAWAEDDANTLASSAHKDDSWDSMLNSLSGYTNQNSASPSHPNKVLNAMLDQLQPHKNVVGHDNKALDSMLDQLQPQKKVVGHDNKALNAMLDQLQPQKKVTGHDNKALNSMLDQLQPHKNVVGHDNKALNAMLDQLQPQKKVVGHDNKALNAMLDQLQPHKTVVGHDNKALNSMLDQLQPQKKVVGHDNKALNAMLDQLQPQKKVVGHDNKALNEMLDKLESHKNVAAHDNKALNEMLDKLESHKNVAAHDNKALNEMLDDLSAEASRSTNDQKTPASPASHKDAEPNTPSLPTFADFIKGLDQDFQPIINNSRAAESEAVTHQNEASLIDEQNSRLEKALNLSVDSVHEDDPYFTNTDQRTEAA